MSVMNGKNIKYSKDQLEESCREEYQQILSKLTRDERKCYIEAHLENNIAFEVYLTSLSLEEETHLLFHYFLSNPKLITIQTLNFRFVISEYNTDLWDKHIYLFYIKHKSLILDKITTVVFWQKISIFRWNQRWGQLLYFLGDWWISYTI